MKKIITILLLAVLLLFAGCSSGGNSSSKQTSFEIGAFNGGDDAVTFSFVDNAPPSKIFDQSLQPFTVRLMIKNSGEADIAEGTGHVVLDGFNPSDLGDGDFTKDLIQLNGVKKQGSNTIPGGRQQVTFENLRYTNSVVSGVVPIKLYANICYPYKTNSMALVCINGDTTPAIDKKTEKCQIDESKQFANSGAPVQIENFEQYSYGSSAITIQFDIVHKPTSDSANIYAINSIDSNCDINGATPRSNDAITYKDKVKYTVNTGLPNLNCGRTNLNSDTVTLIDNKFTVTCIQDTIGQDEYEKPISIQLDYDYFDRISVDVDVEHIEQ